MAVFAGSTARVLMGVGVHRLEHMVAVHLEAEHGADVRAVVRDRLGNFDGSASAYRLMVTLDDNITAFGIRGDRAATYERRTLRARYQLVDSATGSVLLDATASSDAGIDIVSSEYATVAAEQTALERLSVEVAEQIISRVALYASRTPADR